MFKKKFGLIFILVTMCVLLCSCGKVDMDKAEDYGRAAGQERYESYEHIEDIIVLIPEEGGSVQKILEDNVGSLDQCKTEFDLKNTQAIVLENFVNEDGSSDDIIYFVGKKAKSQKHFGTLGYNEPQPTDDITNGKIEFNDKAYYYKSTGDLAEELEWLLAETLVNKEKYEEENKDKVEAAIAAEKEAKGNMSDEEWNNSDEYYQLIGRNSDYNTYDSNIKFVEYLEGIIKEIKELDKKDKKFEKKCEKIYEKYLNENLYDCAIASNEILKYEEEKKLKKLKSISTYDKYFSEIKKLQSKGDNYLHEEDYAKLVTSSDNMEAIDESLQLIEKYEVENKLFKELREKYQYHHFENAKDEIKYVTSSFSGYFTLYEIYIEAEKELNSFMAKNGEAVTEYEDGIKALEEKYGSKKEYKKDIEYKKLQTKYGDIMKEKKELNKALKEAKKDLETSKVYGKSYEEAVFATQYRVIEEYQIVKYIDNFVKEIDATKASESLEKSKVIGDDGSFVVVKMSDSIVYGVDSNRSVIKSSRSYSSGSSSSSDKARYDSNDPYYSSNDHDGDGYMSGNEFQDALNDAVQDKLNGLY